MNAAAVIVAGGQGTRLGSSLPKAFVELGGRPLFTHSLAILEAHPSISSIVLVVPMQQMREAASHAADAGAAKLRAIVPGGEQRWHSVRNGSLETPEQCDTILVHDAARPFVTHEVVDALLLKAQSYRAVITVTPVVDTIRSYEQDRAGPTVDRRSLVRVGTPQLFRREDLLRGFEEAESMEEPPTDEARLMQELGIEVGIAWGDELNFKITTSRDLALAHAIVLAGTRC